MACLCRTALLLLAALTLSSLPAQGVAHAADTTDRPGQHMQLPGHPDPAIERLLNSLRDLGAEIGVAVRRLPGVGRDTLAPKHICKGDVLARIPVELTYAVNASHGLEVSARTLLTDMARDDSPWAHYFRALPDPSGVLCALNMPRTYLRILQDSDVEPAIRLQQAQAEEEWQRHSLEFWQSIGAPSISRSSLTYAMSLLTTRKFGFAGQGLMLPVVDLANHRPACKNYINLEPCEPTPELFQWLNSMPAHDRARITRVNSQQSGCACSACSGSISSAAPAPEGSRCVVWRAGEPLAAGQPICYGYKPVMLQDAALLNYGFLQEGPLTEELSMLDRPDRIPGTGTALFQRAVNATAAGLPPKFAGTPIELQAELERLTARLQQLTAGEATVAAVAVDTAADPGGRVLAMFKEWRRQRLGALAAEIDRIRGLLSERPELETPAGVSTS